MCVMESVVACVNIGQETISDSISDSTTKETNLNKRRSFVC